MGIAGGAPFWDAVRGNLTVLADAKHWWQVVSGDNSPVIEDAAFNAKAAAVLPQEPWNGETWGAWTNCRQSGDGRQGKGVISPLAFGADGRKRRGRN